jgi:hypothetical protein
MLNVDDRQLNPQSVPHPDAVPAAQPAAKNKKKTRKRRPKKKKKKPHDEEATGLVASWKPPLSDLNESESESESDEDEDYVKRPKRLLIFP